MYNFETIELNVLTVQIGDLLFCDDPQSTPSNGSLWYLARVEDRDPQSYHFTLKLVDTNNPKYLPGYIYHLNVQDISFYSKVILTLPYCQIWRETNEF